MKNLLFLLAMLPVIASSAQGTLKGMITDSLNGDPLPFVNLELLAGGQVVSVVNSDMEGNYKFMSLKSGEYSLKARFIGYEEKTIAGIQIIDQSVTVLHFSMEMDNVTLSEVMVMDYKAPLIQCESQCSMTIITGGSPHRGSRSIATVVNGDANLVHNTESYSHIEENGFKNVLSSPLSTFSIDVDKASYSNTRRFLNNSQLPNPDAVRIEELINYFDYSYTEPNNGDPFSVTVEVSACPWNEGHQLIMVGLKGEEKTSSEIPPSNLVFLLDVSGSMDEANKLPLLQKSMNFLVDNLRENDRVAIVVYAGNAGLVLESTPGSDKLKIKQAIGRLKAGGSTAGGQGLELAYKIATENFLEGGNNRIILATDGDFNIGPSSDGEMVRLIEEKRKTGVAITVLGFGMYNLKDSKMEQIADAGNGNYYYIDNILEAKKIFGEELWGTLFTIASDVKIQVEFNPARVASYRLVGYENRMLNAEDFNDDTKDAGEIGSGHTVTALYEIVPTGIREDIPSVDSLRYHAYSMNYSEEWMTLKLRYKAPGKTESMLIERPVSKADFREEPSSDFLFACAVAEFGMILTQSEFRGTSAYDEVEDLLKKADQENDLCQEFEKLVKVAGMLSAK